VTSIDEHKAMPRRAMAQQMRNECAIVDGATTEGLADDAVDQDFDESGQWWALRRGQPQLSGLEAPTFSLCRLR
jgi:hypothetical protein